VQSDFMLVPELEQATTFHRKSIYNMHSSGQGPLAPLLVKLGGKLGVFRTDYDAWLLAQRRIKPSAAEQRPHA
jgi:predicted DNA-binding transcriptional regulator AlpA